MLEAGDSIGRYRIVSLIGSGGMGEVYLAEDTELQRRIAIKLFTRNVSGGDTARDHLLHEARAASSLSHPNVCTVFEVGDEDGQAYIAMEYVDGRTLDVLIAGRDLPGERVVRYGAQIAAAVAHAHDNGVIHRDLKSANVVITRDGRAKVLDFGLASTRADATDSATRDVTSAEIGRISGTLSYMAPETLRGQPADHRSDIWAIGVILYEAATGRLPFTGETTFEVSTAVMKDSADLSADISPGLRSVIQRCLQKAPGERYQSAAEVRAALDALQSGSTVSSDAVSADVAAAARAAAGPRWLPFAAAFSVVAVITLGIWVVFGPEGRLMTDPATEPAPAARPAIGASGRPSIAVVPFRDRTGSAEMAWLAEGVPSMLLTSLAQTEGLDVVSNSRMEEIVAQLGQQTLTELDAATLAEFARRSGTGAVVVGDLYYTGADYRIDVRLEDVSGGRVLDAHSVSGPFVFDLVDQLAAQIVAGLELGTARPAVSIADVTTDSLEAWRRYDEGERARANLRYGDAVRAFEQALEADSAFVMAYYQLARLASYLADPSKAEEYDEYVIAHLDSVPERDRLLVEGMYAYAHDEDLARAEQRFEELVRRYPDHETGWLWLAEAQGGGAGELGFSDRQIATLQRSVEAMPSSGALHNQLGYALADHGRYPEAVRAIERYVELNPEEPNAYDSLAEMYVFSGQPEIAFEKYGDALAVDVEWPSGYYGRTLTAAMLGRYDDALGELEKFQEAWIGANVGPLSVYGTVKATLLSKLGRYDEALQLVGEDLKKATDVGIPLYQKGIEMIGVHVALEAGDLVTAAAFAEDALDGVDEVDEPVARVSLEISARSLQAIIAARSGDLQRARGELAKLRREGRGNPGLAFGDDLVAAELALASGDLQTAEEMFRAVEPPLKAYYSASTGPPTLLSNNHVFRDGIARVRVAEGDIDAAIRIYRSLLTVDIGSKYNAFLDPRYVLRLAELLDENGQADEARAQYLRFVDLWHGADERFQPTVDRARRRAAELGS